MKTFLKNNLIWMFALVLSIGTMSFKLTDKAESFNQTWYWTQNTTDGQDTNYEGYVPAAGSYGCLSITPVYCVIEAPEDPEHPGFPDLDNFSVISRKN